MIAGSQPNVSAVSEPNVIAVSEPNGGGVGA